MKNHDNTKQNHYSDEPEGVNKFLIKVDDFFRKLINFIKTNNTARLLFKLFIVFLICMTVLIIMLLILKPGIDNYESGIYASYVKDIFIKEENKNQDLRIKEEIEGDSDNLYYVYSVEIGGKLIGYAFKEDVIGYEGSIEVIIGIYKDKSLAGVEVINHNETPRMTWFLDDRNYLSHFSSSYIESADREKIIYERNVPSNARNESFKEVFGVDTVTGATISMNALLKAIGQAFDKAGAYIK